MERCWLLRNTLKKAAPPEELEKKKLKGQVLPGELCRAKGKQVVDSVKAVTDDEGRDYYNSNKSAFSLDDIITLCVTSSYRIPGYLTAKPDLD